MRVTLCSSSWILVVTYSRAKKFGAKELEHETTSILYPVIFPSIISSKYQLARMAVATTEESDKLKLNELIVEGSLDFEDWTKLISYVEQLYHDEVDKITWVYDSFLSEFPLCYGYWKKYAEHKARLCSVEKAVQIFERAVELVPYSVGIWVDYCSFSVSSFEDTLEICRLFERGLSFVGMDYQCHILWDKYIEYAYSQQHWNSLAEIYIQTLKFPTKKLHQYYESFKKLVAIWEEMGCQGNSSEEVQSQHEIDYDVKPSEYTGISFVINELLDPSTRSQALQKYISIGEHFYQRACDLDAKVRIFEQNIHRPYFHVKPLDDDQLQNWHRYLDLVEMEGDFDWIVKLYERCLIACANYPEFWMRYVDFMESKGGKEIANDALARATNTFLKDASEIHLFNAWHKEKEGDVEGVRAAFLQCNQESDAFFIDVVRRKANTEKRLGNYVAASDIYREAIELAAEKRLPTLPVLYVHFARFVYKISKDVEATRGVLLDGIQHVPHSKLLVKELILFALMHEGTIEVDVLDSIVVKALTLASHVSSSLCTQDLEELSILYLEFIDLCGSIHDVRRAWSRHLKLFPQLVRLQSSLKKPVKAGGLRRILTWEKAGRVNSHPQKPFGDHREKCGTIQLPSQEVRLMGEKNKKSEPARCGATGSNNQVADESDPPEVVKNSKSHYIQQEEERSFQQDKPPALDDESQIIITSPSPRLGVPKEVSLSNASTPRSIHDIDEKPLISDPRSPRDDKTADGKAAEKYDDSSGPFTKRGDKNALPAALTDRPSDRDRNQRRVDLPGKDRLLPGSLRNSEERLERSLSPRRRGYREYSHDRRYRERSLSPRWHSGRRYSEDRWRRERNDRYYDRHQDNSRGHRDGRMQNQNQPSVCAAVQTSNVQQQIASQAQLPLQPIAFPQASVNEYPLPSNEQYRNVQNDQLYNQMWQYYYYTQQQHLLFQQQQPNHPQQIQQMQPSQQEMKNTQQQYVQNPQQSQQVAFSQQQLLLQYHQQFYQQQFRQQQPTEQPQPQQQQLQSEQLSQLAQQQLQQQQLPQMQHEEVNLLQQQQQACQYQELQKQQYLHYLQQLQPSQHSQRHAGLSQDQQSSQQQQNGPKKLPEMQNGDAKPNYQHDDGSKQVSTHCLMGRQVESTAGSTSGAEALAQCQDELPEIEGTDG